MDDIGMQYTGKYKIIVLPAPLYRCQTWSDILRDENSLRVFKYVLRRAFGPKKARVTGTRENCTMNS
jgi:hypothetical protein